MIQPTDVLWNNQYVVSLSGDLENLKKKRNLVTQVVTVGFSRALDKFSRGVPARKGEYVYRISAISIEVLRDTLRTPVLLRNSLKVGQMFENISAVSGKKKPT